MEIVRDANGDVLAAIDLSDDGVVPETLLEEGQTLETVEVRRKELFDDLGGTLKKFSRKG
jgi:hypothetical protein